MSKIDEIEEQRKKWAADPNRREQIKKNARMMAEVYEDDWKIYLGTIMELTGMTLSEAMQYEQMVTWNDMIRHNRALMSQLEDENKDDWQKPGE